MPHLVPRVCCLWREEGSLLVLTDPGISARGPGQGDWESTRCVLGTLASPIEHPRPLCVSIVLSEGHDGSYSVRCPLRVQSKKPEHVPCCMGNGTLHEHTDEAGRNAGG